MDSYGMGVGNMRDRMEGMNIDRIYSQTSL